jgi:pyruvate/2-oxoglutarate dehydrogenase complex dihydrolipoamide dehydrogenase (E3) component
VKLKHTGLDEGLENSDNPTLIRGHARFEGRTDEGFKLRIGGRSVLAKQVVLDTGTRTLLPPIEGLDEVEVMTFDMEREKVKAREIGENKGLITVVADAADERILGAAALSAEGAELVHVYFDLMNVGATLDAIRNAIHIHPTLAEDIQSAIS